MAAKRLSLANVLHAVSHTSSENKVASTHEFKKSKTLSKSKSMVNVFSNVSNTTMTPDPPNSKTLSKSKSSCNFFNLESDDAADKKMASNQGVRRNNKFLSRSRSVDNFFNLTSVIYHKSAKEITHKKVDPVLQRKSSMANFTPAADPQLVTQLFQELQKVRPPSVSRQMNSIQVYHRRWYILIVFSLLAGLQAYIWNSWGPIASTCEHAYDWTDSDIAFYANWGPICYIPMVIPFSWLISAKGPRWALLVAACLVAVGSGLRCIIVDPPYNKWMIHSGHLLNGVAGPIAKGMGPVISAVWFPPDQRTTATAIMSGFQWFAIGISSIAGPLAVPETFNTWNKTHRNFSESSNISVNDAIITLERRDINNYMYGSFGVCAAVLLVIMVYFPTKPPRPPSPSASITRLDYWTGMKRLLRHRRTFWFVAILYGASTGIREAWSSMLNVNLKSHGILQIDAGWIGFYASIAGWIAGIVTARFTEVFKKRFKLFLIILYFLSTVMYIWLTLTLVNILPSSKASLYSSIIISSIVIGSTTPLFYESACEIAYPISEGIANLVLTMQANIASLIFLGILSIPNIGTLWMNWLLIATFAACTIILMFMKESYARSNVDDKTREKQFTNI